MNTETRFCPRCQRDVQIRWTTGPTHEGHAPLADGPELVCLDVAEACADGVCPHSNLPALVMEVRLAKSDADDRPFVTARTRCAACGETTEMRVLDAGHLLCAVCGTTNRSILGDLLDHGQAAPQDL